VLPPESPDRGVYWSDSEAPGDDDGAPVGSLCAVVPLKSTKRAQRTLERTRRRTDAAAFREHARSMDPPPASGRSVSGRSVGGRSVDTPEAIELAELLREAKRTYIIRRRHEAAQRVCARRQAAR
jgi:hypothetical protein